LRPCHSPEDNWSNGIFIRILQTRINFIICDHRVKNEDYLYCLLLLHCTVMHTNTSELGVYSQDVWKVLNNWRAKLC
jgi:hypothetical protein